MKLIAWMDKLRFFAVPAEIILVGAAVAMVVIRSENELQGRQDNAEIQRLEIRNMVEDLSRDKSDVSDLRRRIERLEGR